MEMNFEEICILCQMFFNSQERGIILILDLKQRVKNI